MPSNSTPAERKPVPYCSEQIVLYSSFLERSVSVEISLPNDYKTTQSVYPLLVVNDGQNSEAIGVRKSIEDLLAQKAIPPVIIVAIAAGDRMQEFGTIGTPDYLKRGSKADAYAKFVIKELMPALANYPIDPLEENHVIIGFSLSGLSALSIAWNYPDVFKKVGIFSGSLWWRKRDSNSLLYSDDHDRIAHLEIRKGRYREGMKFWLQAGTQDETSDRNENGVIDSIDDTIDLIVELTKKGYRPFQDIQYLEIKGGKHEPATWAQAMPEFLKWIFSQQSNVINTTNQYQQ